jgi:hypothetical protein
MHFRDFTYWNSFFSTDYKTILQYLQELVTDVNNLGMELGLTVQCLETIEMKDPTTHKNEVVRAWLSSSRNPCWWHLEQALRSVLVGRPDLANTIKRDFGKLNVIIPTLFPCCYLLFRCCY